MACDSYRVEVREVLNEWSKPLTPWDCSYTFGHLKPGQLEEEANCRLCLVQGHRSGKKRKKKP